MERKCNRNMQWYDTNIVRILLLWVALHPHDIDSDYFIGIANIWFHSDVEWHLLGYWLCCSHVSERIHWVLQNHFDL